MSRRSAQEGLSPAAYSPDRLRAAIATGNEAAITPVASQIFLQLAADLSGGSVRGRSRVDWHMPDAGLDAAGQQRLLAQVQRGGGVGAALNSAAADPSAICRAEARARHTRRQSETARRDLIRTNMERWRWLPRNLGARHVLVNVPAFTAALVDDGRVTARHRTVVGARRTPTPQLSATDHRGHASIPGGTCRRASSARMAAASAPAIEVTRGAGGGISVRQPPGPRNALGRVKIEMPNQHAIYLHDTPSQALFGRPVRAFSHGCIRTQNVRDFAALLLAPTGEWNRGGDRPRRSARGRNQTAQPRRSRSRSTSPISPRPRPATAISSPIATFTAATRRSAQALNRAGRAPTQQASAATKSATRSGTAARRHGFSG